MGRDRLRSRQVDTVHGWVEYRRVRYFCCRCEQYSYPLDEVLRVREGVSMSQKKESQVALLSVHMPYEEVEKVYEELRGYRVSKSTAQRRVQTLGEEVRVSQIEVHAGEGPTDGKRQITADGAMVYFREEGWKEVKVGACYKVDEERSAKQVVYTATVGSRETLGERLYELAGKPSWEETQAMGFVSDGASWLGEMRAMYFPKSTEILDFYHVCEYVWEVARSFYGEDTPKTKQWADAKVEQLRKGDRRKIEQSLSQMRPRIKKQRECLQGTQRYFTNHGHKMDYPRYEKMGFHIGSGIAEAACKHVIQSRLKRTGMRWSKEGAENILHLRVLYLNRQWEQLEKFQMN